MNTFSKIGPVISLTATLTVIIVLGLSSAIQAEEFWIRKGSGSAPRPAAKAMKKEKTKTTKRTELKKAAKPTIDLTEDSSAKKLPSANTPAKTSSTPSPTEATKASPLVEDADRSTDGESYTPTFGRPQSQGFRVGVVIKTGRQPIKDVLAYIPVPQEWPEQEVSIFNDEVPGNFEVQEVEQLQGLQRLVLHGRSIESKQTVVALMTYKVTTMAINLPSDTSIFQLPDHKDKNVKGFLMTSEGINFRNKKLRKQAEELAAAQDSAWGKAQAIYDWVRNNIEQLPEVAGAQYLGAQAAFVKGEGFNDDIVSLFIAMCRSIKIPARTVYHDTGSYAEFMLDDGAGNHHWFPCDLVGLPAFGKTVEPKLILQKGDNIKVPGEKGRRKFVPATGICKGISGTVSPKAMNFVREPRVLEDN